ncbi:MAG TPA: hypothetical protein GXZ70_07355 [Clostridiales bacterium]|nr:hypothetical protein [Clostridiales bacterium]
MLSRKYWLADVISIGAAELLYKKEGIATVVTDGKYIQIAKEKPTNKVSNKEKLLSSLL